MTREQHHESKRQLALRAIERGEALKNRGPKYYQYGSADPDFAPNGEPYRSLLERILTWVLIFAVIFGMMYIMGG